MTVKCSKVITLPQTAGTCWFNALLMSIFYSEYSRNLLKQKIKKLQKTNPLYDVYNYFNDAYEVLTPNRRNVYKGFNQISSENILSTLHKFDNKKFEFDPTVSSGYIGYTYLIKLYELLGINNILPLDYIESNLHASIIPTYRIEHDGNKRVKIQHNKTTSFNFEQFKTKSYDVIIIYNTNISKLRNLNPIVKENYKISETLEINNEEYILDSMIFSNFNSDVCNNSHEIAGVTCDTKRFIYNGWIRRIQNATNMDSVQGYPCELMKYDWLNEKGDFCLDKRNCKLPKPTKIDLKYQVCFNTQKQKSYYIYINKKYIQDKIINEKICPENYILNPVNNNCNKIKTKIDPNNEKKCPENYILNPVTNRCNKIKIKKETNNEKKCPENYILNPVTNRCNKIKVKKETSNNEKKCPENYVLNPATNRCNKIKVKKETINEKKCPENYVLNPVTNRCNKIKVKKEKK
jgi:hypothetical protein